MKLSTTRAWSFQVLSILLPLILLLIILELLFRFIPPDLMVLRQLVTNTSDTRPYVLRSDVNIPFVGMFNLISPPIEWQTNAQGLREDNLVPPHSTRFRIATYGDSETFGWSVKSMDTFQKRMEAIDARVEVINLGVPGYNVTNIADHMEKTLPLYHPDLIIYLVHKNDLDDSIEVSEMFGHSHLLLKLRLLYQQWVLKPEQKAMRRSLERQAYFTREINRIIQLCKQHHIPLILAFLHNRSEKILRKFGLQQPSQEMGMTPRASDPLPPLQLVNLKQIIKPFPKLDHHLSPQAFQHLAKKLCWIISSSPNERCIPPSWSSTPS